MKVSVLIAAYNEELFIGECLNSIVAQDYQNFEVIIVNDGSTDNTGAIIDAYSKKFSNLIVSHQRNLGKVSAFNRCYALSSGDLFTFVGADDVLPQNSISERVTTMSNNFSDIVRGRLRLMSNCKLNDLEIPRLRGQGNRSGGALLFNKKIASITFPIPVEFPNEDVWVNLISDNLNFKNGICSEVIYILRLHENNSFSTVKSFDDFNIRYHEREFIIKEFINRFGKFISRTSKLNLINRLEIEKRRFKGDMRLIFLKGNLRHKLWCLLHLNEKTYKLKSVLRRFLMGYI